jgi:hypothetical protein
MTRTRFHSLQAATTLAGLVLLAGTTACVRDQRAGYRSGPVGPAQTTVVLVDDYDYFPGYETYYSRSRHDYVYRDGNAWVRRPAPRGVSVDVLLAAPSVRLDFHDSPQLHHSTVVRSYPKTWKAPDKGKEARPAERKEDRKDGDRKDGDGKPDERKN